MYTAESWRLNDRATNERGGNTLQGLKDFHLNVKVGFRPYKGISIIRQRLPIGPYSSRMPRGLGWSCGGGCALL
jgi:hypothetical protein